MDEIDELRKKLEEVKLPEEARTMVDKELKHIERIEKSHHDYHNTLRYLETLAELPWGKNDDENLDPENA